MSQLIGIGDFGRGVGVRLVGVGIGIDVSIVLGSAASSGGTLAPRGQWVEVSISRGSLWLLIVTFSFRQRNELDWGFWADIESIAMLLFV